MALDQEAAGADCGVVDFLAGGGFDQLHQQAHDLDRRVEFAALLAGAVSEELDQVLVGGAQQVRELEIVIHQHELRLVEMVEQVLPFLVGNLGLALNGVEVDVVLQDVGERFVLILNGGERLVEHVADVLFQVLERWDLVAVLVGPGLVPARAYGHEEGVTVGRLVFENLVQDGGVGDVRVVLAPQRLALEVEFVREAL